MRIVHFADLHIGTETYGRVDPETGLSSRLLDVLKALDELADYVTANGIDAAIFCGDAYQRRDPSQTHQREFARRLRKLSQAGIPVFLLVGNHDLPAAFNRAHSVEIFPTLGVSNIYVANRPGVYNIPTRDGPLQVAALPWARPGTLLAREQARSMSLEDLNREVEARLTSAIAAIVSQLQPGLPAVLAAHIFVAGAKSGSEGSMMMGREPVLLPGSVALPGIDYVALGHIHRAQCLSQQPPVCYAGSLTRLDFSDEDQPKGFYVVEIDPRRPPGERGLTPEFHTLETRKFLTITASITPDEPDPTGTVLKAISRHEKDIAGAIVKLQVTLPEGRQGLIQDGEIIKALKEAHHVTIARQVNREARSRLGAIGCEKLSPLDALEAYLDHKKVTPEQRKVLLSYGETLVKEQEGRE